MVRRIYFAFILCILLFFGNNHAQNYIYTQSFESTNPFQFYTANGTYSVNYFGPSADRAIDGSKSLKMDITVSGNGTKECTYYWKLPVKINLHGQLDFSSYLWMDSETAKYVKLSYNYTFPPTTIQRSPATKTITGYNTWFKQYVCLSDDVIYHADYFAKNKIYGSTFDDFGRELNYIQIAIKAVGSKRLVFYIDKLEVKGTVLNQAGFPDFYNARWADFQKRLTAIKVNKHTEYNNLPAMPNTTGITLTTEAQNYIKKLNDAKTSMNSMFSVIDNNEYFEPKYMDSLNTLLGLYPSWVTLLKSELNNPSSKIQIYSMNPTEYNRLTETNIPCNLQDNPVFKARVCKNEYEPFSLLLNASSAVNNIKVNWSGFSGPGGVIPASALDASIVKVWYQNGRAINGYDGKWLTQELLVKNDALIKIDEATKSNLLLVKRSDGSTYYQNISNPTSVVPKTVKILDSDVLLPFSISAGRNKQLWFTFHAPENILPGKYTGTITITADNLGTISSIPVEIEILPFQLDKSNLTYAIYYHGFVNNWSWEDDPFTSFGKSSKQFLIEMNDLKEHGVLYPTTYQAYGNLHLDLELRNQAGLPKDMLFAASLSTGNPTGSALTGLKNEISKWKSKIAQYGYSDLHAYGIDEATGDWLLSERPAWQAVHEAGAKVFASGYYKHFDVVGDLLDVGVIQPDPRKEQADLYHSKGHKIFNYSNPMVGIEDPEVYRKNYGLLLWKSGYDGMMNYAYQREFKDIWNDFDVEPNQPHPYRDHNFTYPITDGVLSTIQWEGLREGIDDVRYISTLVNKVDSLKKKGINVSSYESFIASIDPSLDLDDIRNEIINKILQLQAPVGSPDPTPSSFALVAAELIDLNTLKLTFSEQLYSGIYATGNYLIEGITVQKVVLSEKNVVTLTTSSHIPNQSYTITVRNLKNPELKVICDPGNTAQYKYSTFTLLDATLINSTTLKLSFSSQIYSGIYSLSNYIINNGVTVEKAALTGKNEITLTTSIHAANKLFSITVRNLKDTGRIVIDAPGNFMYYTYSDVVVVKSEDGTLGTGAALKTQTGSLSSRVAYFNSSTGSITYNVNVEKSGNYYTWGRFYFAGSGTDPNSFYLSIDNGTKHVFGNNNDYYNQWHWGGDGNIESGVPVKLQLGFLNAGEHTITLSARETSSSVMIDMLVLTYDANFRPDDKMIKILQKGERVDAELIEVPEVYSLSQNYPNPFNPSTRIQFGLPASGKVTMKIYDILGKEVALLLDENKDAGYHQVSFNASHLPSGVYIYRIESQNFVQSRKMLLIK